MITLAKNKQKMDSMKYLEAVLKILAVIITLMLVSCEEQIDLPVGDKKSSFLVVDGMITSDTIAHRVVLSLSGEFYMDGLTPRATGATVSIHDSRGNIYPLTEGQPGLYLTADSVYGEIGVTYTLHVDYEGNSYQASSTMQRVPEIDSLSYRYDPYKESYRVLLWGQEPKGKGDNYMWHLYKNGQLVTDQIQKVIVLNDAFIDGQYIKGFEVDWWTNDFNFQPGDEITVAQYSICQTSFEFLIGIMEEHTDGQMGNRPPANIPSNVSNNALGLFYAAAVTYKTVIIQ